MEMQSSSPDDHEGYLPTLSLNQSKESSKVALHVLNIDLVLIHDQPGSQSPPSSNFFGRRSGVHLAPLVSPHLVWTLRKALL